MFRTGVQGQAAAAIAAPTRRGRVSRAVAPTIAAPQATVTTKKSGNNFEYRKMLTTRLRAGRMAKAQGRPATIPFVAPTPMKAAVTTPMKASRKPHAPVPMTAVPMKSKAGRKPRVPVSAPVAPTPAAMAVPMTAAPMKRRAGRKPRFAVAAPMVAAPRVAAPRVAAPRVVAAAPAPVVRRGVTSAPSNPSASAPFFRLGGKNIVFTGTLSIPRTAATAMALNAGAKISNVVTKSTNLVVVGARPGPKAKGANAKGIPFMSEAQFVKAAKN